jgi:hypothetical protein
MRRERELGAVLRSEEAHVKARRAKDTKGVSAIIYNGATPDIAGGGARSSPCPIGALAKRSLFTTAAPGFA